MAEKTNPEIDTGSNSSDHRPGKFPIVGIGASAGGFDALQRLLHAMPDKPGVALVIVQHLARDRPSLAPELLAKSTSMEVRQVHDEPIVKPNHVYIIPPGKFLSITNGQLRLTQMEGPRVAPVAIDSFFRSLAKDQRQCAVGVILSGTGTDGSLGVKAIKEAGGLVLAQQVDSAEHGGMPHSAIQTGAVDHVLPPEQIPEALVRFAEHSYICDPTPPHDESSEAGEMPAGAETESHQPDEEGLASIVSLIRQHDKQDFRNYKETTLLRRTRRRMCLHHIDEFDQYLDLLRNNPDEIELLSKDLLISVTDFFRDGKAWDELASTAISRIINAKGNDDDVRVWVPGCATGEEAYSIAILIHEELRKQKKSCQINVFASDIDKHAINHARAGRYSRSIEADVSSERLSRFFTAQEGDFCYQVNKKLRESVVFADQNLIGDPPFSQLDLICCRNLLIYLKPDVQKKVISLFHFALRCGGYLFLGTAETVGRQDDLFQVQSKHWRIYRWIGPPRHDRVDIPISSRSTHQSIEAIPPAPQRELRLTQLAQQKLLAMMAPRAVLIDRNWRILYINGDVDRYLTHKQGVPSDDLLAKVRGGVRSRLRTAVHRAFADHCPVSVHCRLEQGSVTEEVRIDVRLVHDVDPDEDFALVVFDDSDHPLPPDPDDSDPMSVKSESADSESIIRQLENELSAAHDDLQATVEQFETSNEEFKASNEEVMSINEELQSTNEELETSKEELQSLNEELSTVNYQLAAKVEELEAKHADLENLIAASEVATVCLDTTLCIRWFTQPAKQLIRIQSGDHGRPLSDLNHDFAESDLVQQCQQVLDRLTPKENEVACNDGRSFIRRIVPYRAEDHRIGGVVITFVNITTLLNRERELRDSQDKLQELNRTLEQQVEQRTGLLSILQRATRFANEARTVDQAMQLVMECVASYNGWAVGHVWRTTDDSDGQMESSRIWHVDQSRLPIDQFTEFKELTEQIRFTVGEGLVGLVLESGEAQWIDDISAEGIPWRRKLPDLDLHAAIVFPVTVYGKVVAIMEFLSTEASVRDDRFMEIMPDIGMQLGHVIQRKRLEKLVSDISLEEQRRIGRELHDGISQQLTGSTMIAESIRQSVQSKSHVEPDQITNLVKILKETHQGVRDLSSGLIYKAVDAEDLLVNLHALAMEVSNRFDVDCLVQDNRYDEAYVGDDLTAFVIMQVAREAVHNAVKHSGANRIVVDLTNDGEFQMTVKDDGNGFVVNDRSGQKRSTNGLQIMAYRAESVGGQLQIESAENSGTQVTLRIPQRHC